MRFEVDKEKCIGCGACMAICEEIFELNDDGYAEAKDTDAEGDIKDDAISAMEGCPTSAISEKKD